jgi:AcrR family transcriptional regulator
MRIILGRGAGRRQSFPAAAERCSAAFVVQTSWPSACLIPVIKAQDCSRAKHRTRRTGAGRPTRSASTGILDVVTATGLNRSSLYATFGGQQELCLAALRRYLEQRSQPMFRRLAEDERGLPAISEFFAGLIEARCSGAYARWGCMVSNAHAGAENSDPGVRAVLDQHHQELRDAVYAALVTALAPACRVESVGAESQGADDPRHPPPIAAEAGGLRHSREWITRRGG